MKTTAERDDSTQGAGMAEFGIGMSEVQELAEDIAQLG